jgi:hypothetical protein
MSDLDAFEQWLRTVCFQKPTAEAYDLAKCAWQEGAKANTQSAELQDKPVAWQFKGSADFRITPPLPQTASMWRPLYAAPPQAITVTITPTNDTLVTKASTELNRQLSRAMDEAAGLSEFSPDSPMLPIVQKECEALKELIAELDGYAGQDSEAIRGRIAAISANAAGYEMMRKGERG